MGRYAQKNHKPRKKKENKCYPLLRVFRSKEEYPGWTWESKGAKISIRSPDGKTYYPSRRNLLRFQSQFLPEPLWWGLRFWKLIELWTNHNIMKRSWIEPKKEIFEDLDYIIKEFLEEKLTQFKYRRVANSINKVNHILELSEYHSIILNHKADDQGAYIYAWLTNGQFPSRTFRVVDPTCFDKIVDFCIKAKPLDII